MLLYGDRFSLTTLLLDLLQQDTSQLDIGIIDFTHKQLLAKCYDAEIVDTDQVIRFCATSKDDACTALNQLFLIMELRKRNPTLPGIWVLLVNGLDPFNSDIFERFLREERDTQLYVVATSKKPFGSYYPLFSTIVDEGEWLNPFYGD